MGPVDKQLLAGIIDLSVIQAELDKLNKQAQEVRGRIQAILPEDGFQSAYGTASWTHRSSFKYPDGVKTAIKHIQEKAKADGLCEETKSVSMAIRLK